MKTDRLKIIEVLKTQENQNQQFNTLLDIFLKHPNHNRSEARFYNVKLYTKETLSSLIYGIKKLFNISDSDILGVAVPLKTPEEKLILLNLDTEDRDLIIGFCNSFFHFSKIKELLPESIPQFTKGLPGNLEMKKWLSLKQISHIFKKKADLFNLVSKTQATLVDKAYNTAFENLIAKQKDLVPERGITIINDDATKTSKEEGEIIKNLFQEAPDDVKSGVKFRVEFPFLEDDDCPDEFKILVADKITAFNNFTASREKLKKLIDNDKEALLFEAAAAAVVNFELNLEIYDELNYYKEHKDILGNHPIFKDLMLARKVADYKEVDLKQIRANLRSAISQQKAKKKAAGADKDTSGIDAVIAVKQKEIDLINVRLEVND